MIGNPPYLSQMATATTRGGSSGRGGGPYADAAVEFLALAGELVDPDGGRVALVLPQSLLASRDATDIRTSIGERAHLVWSWWTGRRVFDAQVHVCVLAFEFGRAEPAARRSNWSHVVTSRHDVPAVPAGLATDATLGDRARLNANFRDEYYGMIPAVGDHDGGPPLITSGLVDPGRSWWGARSITFAKQRFERPRVDLARLDDHMARWAQTPPRAEGARGQPDPDRRSGVRPPRRVAARCARARPLSDRRPTGTTTIAARPPSSKLQPGRSLPCSRRRSPRPGCGIGARGRACRPTRSGCRRSLSAPCPGRAAISVRRSKHSGSADVRACGGAVDARVRHLRRRRAGRVVERATGADRGAAALSDAAGETGALANPGNLPPSTAARGRRVR